MVSKFLTTSLAFIGIIVLSYGQSPLREFRGVWIATVENIDWPSAPGLPSEVQKQEFVDLLDQLKSAGMNAVVVQVRPAGDALYPSPLEPWSPYLTGQMDQAPDPYYDPLQFMIIEAHKRSMEFHAWLNPYRALNHDDYNRLSINHPRRRYPHLFLEYGGKHYFNPGEPRAQQHVVQVIRHLISQYNIDAVHFDDYFYPYKVPNEIFPDELSYKKYGNGFQTIDDWRRNNINELVKRIHLLIKSEKPEIQFGISPFSVWRNMDVDPINGSPTKAGQTCYDDLYADILLWLKKGWIDYVAPQLYFPIGFDLIDTEVMMHWWAERSHDIPVYVGKGLYRVGSDNPAWKNPYEIPKQVELSRKIDPIQGSIYFSARSVLKNNLQVVDRMKETVYTNPALLPVRGNPKQKFNCQINVNHQKKGRDFFQVNWTVDTGMRPHYYTIYRCEEGQSIDLDNSAQIIAITPFGDDKTTYVDRSILPKTRYIYQIIPMNRNHQMGVPSLIISTHK